MRLELPERRIVERGKSRVAVEPLAQGIEAGIPETFRPIGDSMKEAFRVTARLGGRGGSAGCGFRGGCFPIGRWITARFGEMAKSARRIKRT
jgi:hypothetical protein